MTTAMHGPWTWPVRHSETREDASRTDDPGREAAWIAWFGDASSDDVAWVGGTGITGGAPTAADAPVWLGFVVTADAYLRALDHVGGRGALRFRLSGVDVDDPSALAQVAKQCQALVRSAGMPAALRNAVLDAYARLGRDVPVTVHVSTADAAPPSFAAMDEMFTNVRGGLELVDRIVDCWASRWSPRVVAYRAARGVTAEPTMAVIVQPMVDA